MRPRTAILLVLGCLAAASAGCGTTAETASLSHTASAVSVDASNYLLAEEPTGAIGVIDARESTQNGDEVAVVGRICAGTNPWIEGRAAFTMLDPAMAIVADDQECADGELCTGDCCAADRVASSTLVKFVDDQGSVIAVDARQLLALSEGDMVVVQGHVKKDENGNFALLADGVYVRK